VDLTATREETKLLFTLTFKKAVAEVHLLLVEKTWFEENYKVYIDRLKDQK